MATEPSRGFKHRESKLTDQSVVTAPKFSPREPSAEGREPASPLVHIPLYCAPDASDYAIGVMLELHLACLDSYFTHENDYDLLVTTNHERPLKVLSTYKEQSGNRFELRFVSRNDLLSTFGTDESRLSDIPCVKTIFSKFYPILNREHDAILHLDYDTIFVSKVDLGPLLVSDIGLVDANQFMRDAGLWCPTVEQAAFFRIDQPVQPVSIWINSGVFSVQRSGFEICRNEIGYYLENLQRAVADGLNVYPDELIMNALALREKDAVGAISDYRYNFLAYYLTHDPSWIWRGQIVHFHSLKPHDYWYRNGSVEARCDATQHQRLNEDLYLAVLMWCRHLHAACSLLSFNFPMISAMPPEIVEKELARLTAERGARMCSHRW